MTTVIAYHDVKDVDHWLASTVRDEAFASIGVTAIAPPRDPYADLQELARLHESGVLTDGEFTSAKARVLDPDADPV